MRTIAAPTSRTPVRVGMLLVGFVAVVCLLWLARHVLLLGFLAILIAVVFSFPVGWLGRIMPRGLAVLLVLAGLVGALAGLGVAVAPTLSQQFQQMTETAPKALREARRWVERVEEKSSGAIGGAPRSGGAAEQAPPALANVAARTLPALIESIAGLTAIVLVIVLAAFLAHRPDVYRRGVRRLVPAAHEGVYDELCSRLGQGLRRWVGGIIVSMATMGTLTAIALRAVGIQDWLLLGVFTFLGTFVPYLGAVASAIPGLLIALAQSPHHFVLALLVYLGVHVVEGYVVEPLVMRRAVELNPAVLLLGQGILGAIFGVLGIVVGAPLLACAQTAVDYLWVERRLRKQAA